MTSTTAERRFTTVPVETRAAAADKRTIGGYAAKFGSLSRNLGGFVEQVAPGAFNKSRGDGWPGVIARYNHDDNMVLGTTGGGTLRLGVDDVGLTYEADVPAARSDVYELIQRGDVRQSSFAFVVHEDEWSESEQNFPMRTLLSVRLLDVAPVNSPAYEATSVGTRSLDDERRSIAGALVGPAAAFESLARKFDAPLDEVRALAAADELRKFFRRTDEAPKPLTVADAMKAWR